MGACPTEDLGHPKVGSASPQVKIYIGEKAIAERNDRGLNIKHFQWSAFVNGGYFIKCRIYDPYWNYLREIIEPYLETSRNKPTPVLWQITYGDASKYKTEERLGYMTEITAVGGISLGNTEFIAIDPPTFFLNAGNVDGGAYVGNVKSVIEQVVYDYTNGKINVNVGDTDDYNRGRWYANRQDPLTFIRSLLDWSSKATRKKTNWIIAANDTELLIKEQANMDRCFYGVFSATKKAPGGEDVGNFSFVGSNFISTYQTEIVSSGISAVSGMYLSKDIDVDKEYVRVKDDNTENKVNTTITNEFGYKRPDQELNKDKPGSSSGATHVMSIPEHNAGDVGIKYQDYIDGRGRNQFLRMLSLMMRLKIVTNGYHHLHDATKLGTSWLTLDWKDADDEEFFLSRDWLIYGWNHIVTPGDWKTEIFLNRLDFDSNAKKIPRRFA